MCLVDSLSVFLIVQITAFNLMQDNWTGKLLFSYRLSVGFLLSACRPLQIMRRGQDLLFSYRPSAGFLSVYRPMQDNGRV